LGALVQCAPIGFNEGILSASKPRSNNPWTQNVRGNTRLGGLPTRAVAPGSEVLGGLTVVHTENPDSDYFGSGKRTPRYGLPALTRRTPTRPSRGWVGDKAWTARNLKRIAADVKSCT